jgi:histidinol-phosphate phosphatase family protein
MNLKFDKSWTVFLDRDGVINKERRADYVKNIDEFIFEEGALAALKKLNEIFGVIVIVTNQRGVGSGIMSAEDLHSVHDHMLEAIHSNGGRIDKIYFAPDEDRNSTNRKPHPTMGHQAKNDFPEIDFSKTLMIGNSISDMEFGRHLGCVNVFIDEKQKYDGKKTEVMDFIFSSLSECANLLMC